MNRPFLLLALLGAGLRLAPPAEARQAADTLRVNVEGAVERALAVSPEVGVETAGLDFANARYRFARANRFLNEFRATTAHAPAPGLTGSALPDDRLYLDPDVRNDWEKLRFFNQIQLQATQPIFTWGELGGSIDAARHGAGVAAAEVEEREIEVAHRTAELYYNLLLADALYRLAFEAGEIVERAKREIRRLLDEGAEDVDQADLFQVQIVEQEYLRRVVEVRQRRTLARSALARQLFLPEGTAVAPADSVLDPIPFTLDSLETYFAVALENRAELDRAAAGLAAREALVRVARSDYYPKIAVAGEARLAYTPGRHRQPNPYISDPLIGRGFAFGLGIRQNLTFTQTRARVEQAEAERNEVRYQLEGARQLILFEVEEAYRNFIIARAALEAQTEALRVSNEWLTTESINFDLELGDTENLVRAVQANLDIKANYYTAVNQYNQAVLRLLRATGTLVDRF